MVPGWQDWCSWWHPMHGQLSSACGLGTARVPCSLCMWIAGPWDTNRFPRTQPIPICPPSTTCILLSPLNNWAPSRPPPSLPCQDQHLHEHPGRASRQLPGVRAACMPSSSAPGSGDLTALCLQTPCSSCSSPHDGDAAPAATSAYLPTSAHAPVTSSLLAPRHSRCWGSGTGELSWHMEMSEPSSLPPARRQAARPGRARDSSGLPAQEPFPPALTGHGPTGGSSLASSFQAGARGLGSGLSCAPPGHSPSPHPTSFPPALGWAMGHRCFAWHQAQGVAPRGMPGQTPLLGLPSCAKPLGRVLLSGVVVFGGELSVLGSGWSLLMSLEKSSPRRDLLNVQQELKGRGGRGGQGNGA